MLPLLRPALLPVIPAFALLCGCVDGTPTGSARVTFIVTADLVPAGSAIHLAGSSPDLGPWNPDAVHLERGADGAWTAALDLPREERFEYKFTRGTWWTEGVGADGVEMPNFALDVPGDTTVRHHIPAWRDLSGGPVVISHDRLANKGGTIELYDRWRYRAGDSLAWASPAYDDGAWPMVPSLVSPSDPFPPERAGRGWFRLHLKVDSALAHAPLAWSIAQTGASEVYLNGRLIARLGTLGTGAHDEVPFEERTPRVIVMDGGTDQLLAIRYSDFAAARLRALEQPTGLTMYLGPADVTILSHTDRTRIYSAVQVGLVTLALVLAALHLFLYLFNRSERGNLYFSLLIAAMALLSYADLESFFATAREQGVFLSRLSSIGALALSTASLGAVYTFDRGRRPVQFPFFAATAAGLTAWLFFGAGQTWNLAFTGFMGVSALEILRVVAVGFVRDLKSGGRTLSGSWMIGSGGIIFVLGILYQIAANLNLAPLPFTGLPPFYLGFIMFAVSISLQFAYRAGRVNRELAAQLDQVRALSARTLEQERRAREEEVSRRILEADNTRKTRELEEARRVQLAMLPADVPHVAGITIAVRMRTATEVGGDYYDFRQDDDGSVTIAIGDATGHGTKAGIMVTLIKSLFNVSGHSFYIPDFFQHCTSAIRRMNIEQLYMALQIARIKGRRLTVSSAGMPPLYVYRAASGSVEEVVLKGMPLGAFAGFPYQQISLDLHPGDTMLLLSDGFPERFNMGAEILGYGRVKEIFAECGSREPEAVIDHLVEVSERWSGGAPLNDDMTFIVIQGV
jgi:serine phosphatase RsbU (regulator of sigma subunit)